jgi:hypothetical protein
MLFFNSVCQPREGQLRKFTRKLQDVTQIAAQGKPIVLAIYQFKRNSGLWPQRLKDLTPKYISEKKIDGWSYQWWPDQNRWHLTCYAFFPELAVRYEAGPSFNGWKLTDGTRETKLQIKQPKCDDAPLPTNKLLRHLRQEMERRIAREPRYLLHYKGLVSLLVRHKRYRDAAIVAQRCLKVWPDNWWINLMVALIEAKLGKKDQAGKQLGSWAKKKKDFGRYFFLAYYYGQTQQQRKMFATLEHATKFPLADIDSDFEKTGEQFGWGGEYLAIQGAMLAYQAQRYDIALAICNKWEAFVTKEKGYGDASYLVIRAASYLALGKFAEATRQAKAAFSQREDTRFWLDNEIESLHSSIVKKDKKFAFSKGTTQVSFTPIIQYH